METKTIKVLDKGYVTILDHMGNDSTVVERARQSVNGVLKDETDTERQIRDLMRQEHTQPFEFVEFTFQIKLPIFVARQIVRHRTASILEVSGRYTELPSEFYVPEEDLVSFKDPDLSEKMTVHNVKNPEDWWDCLSAEQLEEDWSWSKHFEDEQDMIKQNYNRWINSGCRKELSRINLPLSTYTQWYWKMDLSNLFKFLKLRMGKHAQWEIRQYANAIFELIKTTVPYSCQAFQDYVLNSMTLSAKEVECLQELIYVDFSSCCVSPTQYITNKKELSEFQKKLDILLRK